MWDTQEAGTGVGVQVGWAVSRNMVVEGEPVAVPVAVSIPVFLLEPLPFWIAIPGLRITGEGGL